ncbi:MAG: hypothetical protein ACPLKV_00330 [Minisyncoccia bacterium]
MPKKKIFLVLLLSSLLIGNFFVSSQKTFSANSVNIYFFWGDGCPHCAHEKPFLEQLQQKYPEVKVYAFEVWYNAKNRELLMEASRILNQPVGGVPFTVVGNKAITGYLNDEVTGAQIESYVLQCRLQKCDDPLANLVNISPITPTFTPLPSPTPTPIISPTITPVSEMQLKAYFFWSSGCPLCNAEKNYLETLKEKYPNLEINNLELSKKENLEIFKKTLDELKIENAAVPLFVIGKKYVLGWKNETETGSIIEEAIQCAIESGCPDVVGDLISSVRLQTQNNLIPEVLKLPLFGEIKTKNLSLPLLAVIMGGLDGFNPCAMWVLIFLISFLLGMKDRKRMWILGGTFLFISGLVYFLFMAAWLKFILFVGAIFWVRLAIALVAIGAGFFSLKEAAKIKKQKHITCDVTNEKQKKKTIERIKETVHKRSLLLAIIGIVALAFSVNLVELVCSAGFPVVFTQILALSNLKTWQYLLYMLIYIILYMLDDIIVFVIAMITLKIAAESNRYVLYSRLIGGILMVIIGLLLIFKPTWLMFG